MLASAVNRAQLIDMCADSNVETLPLCISILAWGGMHGSNRDHLFQRSPEPWLTLAQRIRDGSLTRQQAFDGFSALIHEKKMTGMKGAYFTKLIYFLMPRSQGGEGLPIGYIMDQWVGCSINLLAEQDIVKMNHSAVWKREGKGRSASLVQSVSSHVSEWNSGEEYEAFCGAVEALAREMGPEWSPEQTELALMSKGGPEAGRVACACHGAAAAIFLLSPKRIAAQGSVYGDDLY